MGYLDVILCFLLGVLLRNFSRENLTITMFVWMVGMVLGFTWGLEAI